ncbi:MAG TPA: hypothetical protein VK524_08595, partial [Polyangiaceae bacterium]|nr:hypothetical protein [Polyangiaceae bacterium]
RDIVNRVELSDSAFDAISAGETSTDSAERLSSLLAETVFAELRRQYDFIIVDAAPFPLAADSLLLSTYADLVLSVARPGNTRRDLADEHVRRLSALVPCAFVINDVDAATCERNGYAAGARVVARTPVHVSRTKSSPRVSSSGAE